MKKLLVLTALLGTLSFHLFCDDTDAEILLYNDTDYAITEVYFIPLGSDDLGNNYLAGTPLVPQDSVTLTVGEDQYILIVRVAVHNGTVDLEDSFYFEAGAAYEWNITADDIAYFSGGLYGDPYAYYEDTYGYLDSPYGYLPYDYLEM